MFFFFLFFQYCNPARSLVLVGDLHWTISHSSLSQEEKEKKLNKARERQQRPYWLPPGVSVEEMEEIWNQLDFGGRQRQLEKTPESRLGDRGCTSSSTPFIPLEEKESTFDPSSFSAATRNILLLRELSMKGKVDMESVLEKTKGQPKLVWGEPEAYVDQVELGGVPSETEAVGTNGIAGESLALGEEITPADENTTPSGVTVQSSNRKRKRRKGRGSR